MIAIRILAAVTLVSCAFAFAACSDDPDTAPTKAADGEPCEDGAGCESKLCFVTNSGEEGECRAAPSACSDDLSCDEACLDALVSECPAGGGYGCVGIGGLYTVECTAPSEPIGGAGGSTG